MAEVLRLAAEALAGYRQQVIAAWEPALSALVAAHDPATDPDTRAAATSAFDAELEDCRQQLGWPAVIEILRRIHAGERGSNLTEGLDGIQIIVVQRALDALAGRADIEPQAWDTTARLQQLATLAAAVAIAVTGDDDARAEVEPLLKQLADDRSGTNVAAVLQRILAGDRDPSLTAGLDVAGAAVVTALLEQLGPATTSPSLQWQRSEQQRDLGDHHPEA
jgi:hypothetical protein